MAAPSWFENVDIAAPIEVFNLTRLYNEDSSPNKVNLGVGAYRTDEGKPWVLPVVKRVEEQLATDVLKGAQNHEYLPVAGLPSYRDAGMKLLLGDNSPAVVENRIELVGLGNCLSTEVAKILSVLIAGQSGAIQALGGTGALRVGLDFLKSRLNCHTVYVSQPTWGNHKGIAKALGYTGIREYRYWDANGRKLDIDGMLDDLKTAPPRSVILIHMCAHNPSGIDPSEEQWAMIADVIREKNLFPFFDCAYQGFASGNLDLDAYGLRYFVSKGFELFAAQSFSKNFGLYNERTGNLIYVLNSSQRKVNVSSQLEIVVRQTWSNSPAHGCRIVATILNDHALSAEWKQNLKTMADRILLMRKELYSRLCALGTPGTWDHVIKQRGMFSYTGLNVQQSKHMMDNFHIYLLSSGRINMCALTSSNLDYVAQAIHETVLSEAKL